jgi:hypothetical protein
MCINNEQGHSILVTVTPELLSILKKAYKNFANSKIPLITLQSSHFGIYTSLHSGFKTK